VGTAVVPARGYAFFPGKDLDGEMNALIGAICLHVMSLVFFYFGYDALRALVTGDSRTIREGVWVTYIPDLVSGILFVVCGVWCFGLGIAFFSV
jgi:uncharacterized membrane protein